MEVPPSFQTPVCGEQGQGVRGPCESGQTWMPLIRTGRGAVVSADRLVVPGRIATNEAPQPGTEIPRICVGLAVPWISIAASSTPKRGLPRLCVGPHNLGVSVADLMLRTHA
ncbi:hypothetical protein PIB30_106299 [Stylosanthes scabra]|uniref:Uncharacterized protein n=1 Tax=Stylosanthes scabra TaxID=79078 RepID=A0ABU6V2M7_9FABA|nr:hypothetical protein [Stylosanthes scabra]